MLSAKFLTPLVRIFIACGLTVVCSAVLITGCTDDPNTSFRPAKGGKQYGGVFRMNEVQELRGLDPARLNDAQSHHIVHQIADLLVDFDSSLTLGPELALSTDVSPDGLTYTYHLRTDVYFQDDPCFPGGKGRLMEAADVKYCFDRILDQRSGTLGAPYFRDKVKGAADYFAATGGDAKAPVPAGGVTGFRVVDKNTFAIDLLKPFAPFKYYPALGFCYVYPHEAVEKYGRDFFKHLVGTGPFVLDTWSAGEGISLKRNPHYWGRDEAGNQLPLLDGVSMSFIKAEAQQISTFKLGNLEESYRIPTEFFRQVVDESGRLTPAYQDYRLDKVAALSSQFYGMLTIDPVFKDKRIRQAFSYAINRDKIVRFVLQGQAAGPSIHGLTPPSIPGYDVSGITGYNYDLPKARALLAQAGYPDGKGFPKVELQLNNGGGRNAQIAEAVLEMLKSGLGINISMKLLEWPQHLELVDNGKAGFYRLGWIADYPEPENFLNLFYGKNIPPQGPSSINTVRYNNPAFDALFEKAISTLDDAKRYDLYRQAEQVAMNDAPMLLIFNDMDYRLVQKYVRGYTSNSMDRRDLKAVWLDKK